MTIEVNVIYVLIGIYILIGLFVGLVVLKDQRKKTTTGKAIGIAVIAGAFWFVFIAMIPFVGNRGEGDSS